MSRPMRSIARLVLLALALTVATPAALPQPSPAANPDTDYRTSSSSLTAPTVRLRKLHLVRPDLIPYPIQYEVVC